MCAQGYATFALLRPGLNLAGVITAAWFGSWASSLGFGLLVTLTLALFPTGAPPTPRWRPAVILLALLLVLATISRMFRPGPLGDSYPTLVNPFGLPALAPLLDVFDHISFAAAVILSTAIVVVRFRRARGVEREQLKWFAYGVVLLLANFILDDVIETLRLVAAGLLESLLTYAAFLFLVAAVGVAILRYRLYDIDVIIRRTLIYTALTAALALIYFAGVLILESILQPLTGGGNDLAIVATTLLIAALFTPLRRRIQAFIDRRFYRRKYDASQIVAAFGAHLREEVDLATLSTRLVEVVDEAVQPAGVALWLRASDPGRHEGM